MPLTVREGNIYKTPAPKNKLVSQVQQQDDSGFISPPTIVQFESASPCHGYNLRPPQPHRWSSTPLPVSGLSLSTPLLLKSTSTPAASTLSSEDEKPKIENILGFRQRLEILDDNTEYDSGFDSLLADQSWIPSSAVKPEIDESLGAIPKRRSPRRSPRQQPRKPDTEQSSSKSLTTLPSLSHIRLSKEGRERCDIVRGLFEMNNWHTLGHLFKYLSSAELCKVSQVSQFWNLALKENSEHNNRRLQYIDRVKKDKENFGVEVEGRKRISPRRVLREFSNIKNQISPTSVKRERENRSSSSAVVSPSKIRHKLFGDVAKNLTPGERLVQCPLCTSPSRVSAAKAECSSPRCQFVFCPDCQCRDHPGLQCKTTLRQPRSSKSGGVLSKKSKTRLRKL